jgi:ABC-type antimicrobial peptide transport system permease subunit
MRKVLKKRYGEDKLFSFTYLGNLTDEIQNQMEDSNKLLWITGMVTLLLSGVILSSMMLMSVHKRVSEIGIRRAFGARKKDIFYQFLTEGMVIYSIGIVIGLVMGLVLSYLLIVKILSWEYSIPIYSLVLSSVIPFLVSILSSLYPAMQAAKIQPAVAVKYE